MHIDIRTRGFALAPALAAHVERRLAFALDRCRDRVARVRVTVEDVNGPKGGEDKRCGVEVRLRGGGLVRATERDADAFAAATLAVRRSGRGVARAMERERAAFLDILSP